MDEYGWGLTSAGFRRPTYNELLDALEHKARELFGATANLTVRSPLGLFLRIFAWILNILFSVLEDVYNSRFVDTAVGTSLLNLGRAIGLRVLSAQKASGYIMVTGPPGVIVPAGWLVETAAGIQFFAVSDTEIGAEGTVMVPFRCTSTGPDGNVAADTITTITTPGSVAGITAVTNPAAFTGGRERETDEEFRDRYYASVDYAGGVNADSIRAALLQNVDGIMEAKVFENDTDDVDDYGLPPHSIEAIVYGGTDANIAAAIHARKAAGIQTYGGQSAQVLDASGKLRTIKFSRPTPVLIYVQISDLVTSDAYAGDAALKAAIVEYIGSAAGDIAESGLAIGETVYYNRLMCPVNNTPGVVDYTLKVSTDGKTWSKNNIAIDARKKAITGTDKVVIVT